MARKATWQRHADPCSTPRGAIYHILHYVYIYINRSLSSPYKGGSYPYKRSGIIYPTVSINKVRVGLTHAYLFYAGDAVDRGASDRDRSAAIKWTNGPSDLIRHVRKSKNYNGWIVCDVAASHASIAWKQGAPEINQHVPK